MVWAATGEKEEEKEEKKDNLLLHLRAEHSKSSRDHTPRFLAAASHEDGGGAVKLVFFGWEQLWVLQFSKGALTGPGMLREFILCSEKWRSALYFF